MGTIKKGILGSFSGKVGNVVGASWRNIAYMRSLPSSMRNPRTEKQVTQRNRFSLIGKFLKCIDGGPGHDCRLQPHHRGDSVRLECGDKGCRKWFAGDTAHMGRRYGGDFRGICIGRWRTGV